MQLCVKNRSLCWYCSNACNLHKCKIAKGQEPQNVKKRNGFIVSCGNFKEEIPLPITREEFKQRFSVTLNAVYVYWRDITKNGKLDELLQLVGFVVEKELFYKNILELIRERRAKMILKLELCQKYFEYFRTLDYCKQDFTYLYDKLNYAYDKLQRATAEKGVKKGQYTLKRINEQMEQEKGQECER